MPNLDQVSNLFLACLPSQRLWQMFRPEPEWGPALLKYRLEYHFHPNQHYVERREEDNIENGQLYPAAGASGDRAEALPEKVPLQTMQAV